MSWLRGNGIQINTLKETDLIFGKFDNTDDFILINHMLLLGKFYLYSSRCQKIGLPNLSAFIARTKHIYNIEHHIARENNKLLQQLKKWEKLIHLFQCFCNYSGNFLQHTDVILFFAVLYFYCFYYFCICICNVINTLTVSVRKFVGSVIVFVLVLYNI